MFDADDDDDGDGDGDDDDDDASLSAIMAQRRSVSAPPTVFRIPRPPATPPPYVPPPPSHPPPGFNPPALNAHSYHCPQCSNTEFRVYMPDGHIAFTCMRCGLALAMPVVPLQPQQ